MTDAEKTLERVKNAAHILALLGPAKIKQALTSSQVSQRDQALLIAASVLAEVASAPTTK